MVTAMRVSTTPAMLIHRRSDAPHRGRTAFAVDLKRGNAVVQGAVQANADRTGDDRTGENRGATGLEPAALVRTAARPG